MSDPRRSFEVCLLCQLDKVRLVLVGLFFAILFGSAPSMVQNWMVASTTASFAALYVILTHFMVNWRQVRAEGHMALLAALLVCADLFWITSFVWAMGPDYRTMCMLLVLEVLFAASFFRATEVMMVTAVAGGCHLLLNLPAGGWIPTYQAAAGIGAIIVVAWLAYALAEVARQERATTERIVRHLTEGVMLVSPSGKLVLLNQRMEHMTGVPSSEVMGLSVDDPVDAEALRPLQGFLQDAHPGGLLPPGGRVRQFQVEEPEPMDVECVTVPCHTENGQLAAWVIVCKDITRLVGSVRAREEGLAELSHELRGRVHSLRAVSEVLTRMADDLDDETRLQALNILDSETGRLRRLIARLLDVAAVEKHTAVFDSEAVDLATVVESVCVSLGPQAAERSVTLDCVLPECLPPVPGDEGRLDQVLVNLVENALKFTPVGGRVTVEATVGQDLVHLRVSDTGCGITPECLPLIFDKFVHGEKSRFHADGGGLGLGLYMCREIVRRHEGTIEVETTGPEGTVFHVALRRYPVWSEAQGVQEQNWHGGQGVRAPGVAEGVAISPVRAAHAASSR